MSIAGRVFLVTMVVNFYFFMHKPYRVLIVHCARLMRRMATNCTARTQRRRQQIEQQCQSYSHRLGAMKADLKRAGAMSLEQQQAVIAAHVALSSEAREWLESNNVLKKVKVPVVLKMAAAIAPRVEAGLQRRLRKSEELARLLQRIAAPTFWFDFVLWMILPASYGVDLVGDLNEQMESMILTAGEKHARRWYRRQVILAVRSTLWGWIGDIVTLTTLVDWMHRLRRK